MSQSVCLLGGLLFAGASWAQLPPVERFPSEEPSGWLKIELAVIVDASETTLGSEFWPPFPEVRYPSRYRWLVDPTYVAQLRQDHPFAEVEQDLDGKVTLRFPDPEKVIAAAQAEALAARETDADPSPLDENSPTPNTDLGGLGTPGQVPLEMLDEEPVDTRASVDWLGDFDGRNDSIESTETNNGADGSEPVDPVTPPPMPTAFQIRDLESLDQGLKTLLRETGDALAVSLAWLQPPEATNIPVLLDQSGDGGDWPPLQGFVELRRGREVRMGVNLWWNTDAAYYPDTFSMAPPSPAPAQLRRVDQDTGLPLTALEASDRQRQIAAFEQQLRNGGLPIEYVDPATGFYRTERSEQESLALENTWPYRHLIHFADTRALPEGSIRYFDHPVIKVIATYRELSWGEVYQLGQEDHDSALFEAAVEGDDADESSMP